jgi:two-component system cell cycle sensor histidine kinase/response regulator CckA
VQAPLPPDEAGRLKALRRYEILDTAPEKQLDDITLLASRICGTPIAMISLIDEKRQWFKSKVGMTESETSRDIAFCAHGILQAEVFVVNDAQADERFAANPLVTGNPRIRFYAGAPLITSDGHALGMLCVNDQVPREMSSDQMEALRALSRLVVAQLEAKRSLSELQQTFAQLKGTEESLRESEEKFRQLADNITDVFWITSPDFATIHYISRGYQLIWDRSAESLYAHPHQWVEAILPEERERVFATFVRLAGDTREVSIEYRIARPDGTVRWIHDRGFQVRDAQGKVIRVSGIASDITERKKADEALRESEEKFRQLAENITDVFWMTSPDLRKILYVSPAYEQVWGRSTASVYAHPEEWFEAILPGEREHVLATFSRLAAGEPSVSVEFSIARPDGTARWIFSRGFQVRDAAGKVIRITGIASDITERKKADEALRESEERFSGAFEHAPIGVALVSPEGRWLKVNRALCDLVGYSEAELLTRTFLDITHPEDLERDQKNVRRLLAGEIQFYQTEKRYLHRRGHSVIALLNVSLIRDAQGRPRYLNAQIQDITERKRLEARLFQSQKMETVGKLAGGIAHEFNSIMTAIIGQSELLLGGLPAGSPLAQNAAEIHKAAVRAASLTRQLLAHGRKQILWPEILDLNSVLAGMESTLRHLMGRGTDVRLVPAAGLKAVKADAGQIEQVIMNLAMNAADAMPHGGKLTIETANVTLDQEYAGGFPELKAGEYVRLAITDTGTGMSEEVKARVFEPFFSTKAVGEGTGLGLSTCYGIIKQSGGHINVYSELARGATFKVYLPQVEESAKIPLRRLDSPELPQGTETILLAEDDPALREMAAALLRRLGYTVLVAANGMEALSLKQQRDIGHIDLLFTDVVMPHMSGKELSERVRALYPHTKILFTSAFAENAIVHQGVLNPGVALLQKPFTPSALAHKLREVLDEPSAPNPDSGQKIFVFAKTKDGVNTS